MERMAQRQAEAVTSSWAAGPGGSPDGSSTADGDLLINLGEGHPSGHGMLRLRLTLEGDRIVTADPVIGYVHRGAEKLFEARDYRQIIVLANRHDWLGAFASELGVVLAAERLAGIEVPPRGVWARTLLAELNRVLSHLAFLGSYPPELARGADGTAGAGAGAAGAPAAGATGAGSAGLAAGAGAEEIAGPAEAEIAGPAEAEIAGLAEAEIAGPAEAEIAGLAEAEIAGPAEAAARARELLQSIMEEISGGRMHYMFNRVGGLKEDLPEGWLGRVGAAAAGVRADLPRIGAIVRGSERFRGRTRGVGVLTGEQVRQFGVSGPAARASGVDFDLRRDEPYLAYEELAGPLRVITRSEGDCLARFECLLDQVAVSLDLVDACASTLASLPPGPLSARIPKVLKIPEGHTYAWTEGPLGLNGYYLVSRGGKTPWRLKVRSASFSNVQVLGELLPGHRVADLSPILGSMFFVVGDMDR
jgi:NADH:ubiquinone oxidoreductase subunit D